MKKYIHYVQYRSVFYYESLYFYMYEIVYNFYRLKKKNKNFHHEYQKANTWYLSEVCPTVAVLSTRLTQSPGWVLYQSKFPERELILHALMSSKSKQSRIAISFPKAIGC